jgi:hypothetical protein
LDFANSPNNSSTIIASPIRKSATIYNRSSAVRGPINVVNLTQHFSQTDHSMALEGRQQPGNTIQSTIVAAELLLRV